MKNYNEIIANNILTLRKINNLTQLEVAERLHYTDKSVSKWEIGAVTPSIETLANLAELYGVEVEYFLKDHTGDNTALQIKKRNLNRGIISSLSVVTVWFIATFLFLFNRILFEINTWQVFIWAVPFSCLIILIFNSIWGKRRLNYLILSIMLWSLLCSVHLQFIGYHVWTIYLLGIPLQISIILWSQLNQPIVDSSATKHKDKQKKQKTKKDKKPKEKVVEENAIENANENKNE